MATAPAFAAIPNRGSAVASTANTNRDGTGTLATVFTAGASGSRIDYVRLQARVTTAAGTVRLFLSDGTNVNLLKEQVTVGATVSGTVAGESYDYIPASPLILKASETLKACPNNSEAWVITAFGGDF